MKRELIDMPKVVFGKYNNDKNNNLVKLEQKVIKIAWKYNKYGFIDPVEEEFLEKNKGKKITLQLINNKDINGILESLDKYRITIIVDGDARSYYKHAIVSYFSAE